MSLFVEPAPAGRLPVSLIAGFLGSGKTTLLNRLVRHPDMANSAVIVNEFGDVALDQHFVDTRDGEVVAMPNGCLCCTLQGDLEGIVGTLFARRDRGEVPAFARLVVEATGLADPAPIMQPLLNSPLITRNFRLDAVVATVDAVLGPRQLREHEEAVKQIALADRLVVTKIDLAAAEEVERLERLLGEINPGAPVFRVLHGGIEPSRLFGAGLVDERGETRDPAQWLRGDAYGAGPRDGAHHHDIAAFCLEFDEPLTWREFSGWLTRFRIRHADRLLRVKGLVDLAGEDGPVAIHGVHHIFHPPVRLDRWPGGERRSRVVFITRGLARDAVEADWRAFAAAGGRGRSGGGARHRDGRRPY